jgi:hypothetical protein
MMKFFLIMNFVPHNEFWTIYQQNNVLFKSKLYTVKIRKEKEMDQFIYLLILI